jgi:hypothetical protein
VIDLDDLFATVEAVGVDARQRRGSPRSLGVTLGRVQVVEGGDARVLSRESTMSFVATLTTDTKTITGCTWADVEREIDALDSRTQTLVMLAPLPPKGPPEGDHHLTVGGGGGGRFIVYTTEDNVDFWNLTDPERRGIEQKVVMNIGGQEGEYSEQQFVSKELALHAARQYVENGQRARDLSWAKG